MPRILHIKDLKVTFPVNGVDAPAVDGLSFTLDQGKVLGLVGESGCGKTVTALSLLRLIDPPGKIAAGQALFYGNLEDLELTPPSSEGERDEEENTPYEDIEGKRRELTASLITHDREPEGGIDLFQFSEAEMRNIRGNKIAMIFQEPMTSLNPVFTVGNQIVEAIMLHQKFNKRQAEEVAIEMLKKVRISDPEKRIRDYPHQMSGGMRQRVMIAMALSCQPDILIADEPTTALDVTIQAQILELIRELVQEMHMSVLLITHDLGIVAEICDDVLVMYSGMMVEKAPVKRLFRRPKHPYTLGLMDSIPKLFEDEGELLHTIPGTVPDLSRIPEGCRFADRCPRAVEACRGRLPKIKYVGEGQEVRCINY